MPGLDRIIGAVLDHAGPKASELAVDLGCGSGRLSLPLAERVDKVIAVDVSPAMVERLRANAAEAGLTNIETHVAAMEELSLAESSVDLVVSNYALHHVRDADKALVVAQSAKWLVPGGRMVVGDMMLGRGGDSRDRAIIAQKVSAMARKGPAGWWRVVKNAWRYTWRVQERPISMAAWESLLRSVGLEQVESSPVVAEAAVVAGRRPLASGTG